MQVERNAAATKRALNANKTAPASHAPLFNILESRIDGNFCDAPDASFASSDASSEGAELELASAGGSFDS